MRVGRHLPIAGSSGAENALDVVDAMQDGGGDSDGHGRMSSSPDMLWEEAGGQVDEASGERLFQVGDLARATGKTVRAIHHYEDVGLLQPHARSKGRYRL